MLEPEPEPVLEPVLEPEFWSWPSKPSDVREISFYGIEELEHTINLLNRWHLKLSIGDLVDAVVDLITMISVV